MGKRTPLYKSHVTAQAKMVDFAGWEMPLHYGSQLAEHQAVRTYAGVFDVSHMVIIDVKGRDAAAFLRILLANNIDKLLNHKGLYTCLLNEQGKILDDLIVYKITPDFYCLVVNAATGEKDWAWIRRHAEPYSVTIEKKQDLAIVATQGPDAAKKIALIFAEHAAMLTALKPFEGFSFENKWVARTGYTGEDGYEWIVPANEAIPFWQLLLDAGFQPCGLGARDTLRLEAGFNLYGADMDETITPLESNLAWTIAWEPKERDFIGRAALEAQLQQGVKQNLVGLLLEGQGIPRNHQKVMIDNNDIGEITSGSFSPTLKKGIALARVAVGDFKTCWVDIRGKKILAKVVKPPFVKHGKKMV
jgi:aminomethyltransferase